MTPEGRIESYLISQSEKYGILCYKFVSPGNKGVPDRILIGKGKTVFVETKAPKEVPRKLQEYVIKKMKKAGATVYVADTKEAVDAILNFMLEK
jgi:hypothetical protein